MAQLKTNFELEKTLDSFYTGGEIQLSKDGQSLYCVCGDTVNIVDRNTGKRLASFNDDEDDLTCFCLSPDNKILITASRNLLLHQFDTNTQETTRKWKAAHKTPILCMSFDETSTLLASGSSDTTIKIYDTEKQYFTHNLKGSEEAVSVLRFHPVATKWILFSSSANGNIRMWDLKASKCICILKGHFSQVTALEFNHDHSYLISSGRDRVFIIWDLNQRKQLKTIPVFEQIESIVLTQRNMDDQKKIDCIITGGQTGCLRAWSIPDGKTLYTDKNFNKINPEETSKELTNNSIFRLMYDHISDELVTVTYDQNVLFYSNEDFTLKKQMIGHLDEIVGLKYFGVNEEYTAIATNSEQLKIVNNDTFNSKILYGHSGIILSIDISYDGKYISTASKDNTLRIWLNDDSEEFVCIAIGKGHTHWVGCVAWPKLSTNFLISGSQDLTIKFWMMPDAINKSETVDLSVKWTEKAHDKDINAIAVSPNDKLIVTSSQDKLAKVWKRRNGELLGVLRGHRRGIWCVSFSPVDQCVATGSADSTIKIWALSDYTCVKTLEGHSNSVLQLSFIQRGMQIVSSSSDGLIKLWNIREDECVNTVEAHDDKVWALCVKKSEDYFVSGGGDSCLKYWKDITEKLLIEKTEKEEERILQEQNLGNLLQGEKYEEAINAAILLDKPFQVLNIVKDILLKEEGKERLNGIIKSMHTDRLESLLDYLCQWNTNAKHSFPAQTVLSSILKLKSPEYLLELSNIKQVVEALLPYTERHYDRVNQLAQQSMFVNYTWETMKLPSS